MENSKAPNEFTGDGNISDGTNMFPGETLSSNNCEGEIQYITILPDSANKKGDPLTSEEQFALRSELRELMRIARIARTEALYDASVAARTFEAAEETILNPIDFEEIVDLDLAISAGDIQHSHIRGFGEFMGAVSKRCE